MLLAMRRVNDLAGHDRAEKQWTRLRRPAIAALTTATLANYVWQVPYAIHQYGLDWIGFPRLSVLLIVTLAWFVAAIALFTQRRRWGTALLASFLTAEALFYVLHNVSGAFGRDLPSANPIVLIASALGYLNLAAAIVGLAVLATLSRRRRAAGRQSVPGQAVPGQAVPGQAVPGQAVPGQAVPGQAVPGQAVPGQAVPGQAVPGQAVPGQAVPGQAVPGRAAERSNFEPTSANVD